MSKEHRPKTVFFVASLPQTVRYDAEYSHAAIEAYPTMIGGIMYLQLMSNKFPDGGYRLLAHGKTISFRTSAQTLHPLRELPQLRLRWTARCA